jgi:redox-regulated HSP33 family molecular chaperone
MKMENIAMNYWKERIQEIADVWGELELTDEQLEKIANKLFNDDEMWQIIDDTIIRCLEEM